MTDNWPTVDPTKPRWHHQLNELNKHAEDKARALLWGMRTGKSRVIVDSACALRDGLRIKGVLVLAPNGVHMNWVRKQIGFHTWPFMSTSAMAWSSMQARTDPDWSMRLAQLFNSNADLKWFTVNSESLIMPSVQQAIRDFISSCHGEVLAVADESVDFRSAGSKRSSLAFSLFKLMPYKRILDGTALMNSPLHAYSQFSLLEPGALGFDNYGDFKKRYAVFKQVKNWKTNKYYQALDRYTNLEELRERIAEWSSVVLREDCDDMPDLLPITVDVEMSEAQREAYIKLVEQYLLELEDGEIVDAAEGGKRSIKLHQIVSGFIIDDYGDVVSIDDNPPLLQELLRQAEGTLPGKFIVWCRFREDIRRVSKALRDAGHKIVEYHGGVPQGLRADIVDQFNKDPETVGLVGQPQAGGRGLELPCDAIIWYSSTYDAIIRNQANERGTVMGGRSVSIITLATPGTVHDDIVASAEGKVRVGDWISGTGLRDLLLRGLKLREGR